MRKIVNSKPKQVWQTFEGQGKHQDKNIPKPYHWPHGSGLKPKKSDYTDFIIKPKTNK